MNQKDYEILVTSMIDAMAKRIFELVSQGYTKGQIIEYLKKVGELSREEGETTDLISEKMDLISAAVEEAIHIVQKRTLQSEIRRLYQQMADEKNLAYIGKDGRDYYSEENMKHLKKAIKDLEDGKGVEHNLIEVED